MYTGSIVLNFFHSKAVEAQRGRFYILSKRRKPRFP